jgi:phosphopantothenoylcysteine synthetase/decarboxylase
MTANVPKPCRQLLVGVAGSIHATQLPTYLLGFAREFADEIRVIMTPTAATMVPGPVLEVHAAEVYMDPWGGRQRCRTPHIELAQWAELFLVLPATANIIGKAANGIADNLLSTAIMAANAPVVFAPAMNATMWANPALQRNVATLRADGHYVIPPVGQVAVATNDPDEGRGPTPESILPHLWHVLMREMRNQVWSSATAEKPQSPAEQLVGQTIDTTVELPTPVVLDPGLETTEARA